MPPLTPPAPPPRRRPADPRELASALQALGAAFPRQDVLRLLQESPDLLSNLGETKMDPDAEYGEVTTAG